MSWDQIDPFGAYDHSRKQQWQSTTNTDTEKSALCARIDELCAENERLRERLKESDDGRMRQADNLIDKYHKIAHLQTENAKLREFAGQVLYFTTMTDGCGDNCPYSSSDCSHECHLREQGRELGIEVDA